MQPFECWLALQFLETLPLRMERHSRNAQAVAEFLAQHPRVRHVNYPGLPDHPQHQLASRVLGRNSFGAMMSFDIRDGDRDSVIAFMDALNLVLPATTLGDVYTLTLYPAGSSHRTLSAETRARIGIGPGLVRLSVGIEDPADIIADLDQALEATA